MQQLQSAHAWPSRCTSATTTQMPSVGGHRKPSNRARGRARSKGRPARAPRAVHPRLACCCIPTTHLHNPMDGIADRRSRRRAVGKKPGRTRFSQPGSQGPARSAPRCYGPIQAQGRTPGTRIVVWRESAGLNTLGQIARQPCDAGHPKRRSAHAGVHTHTGRDTHRAKGNCAQTASSDCALGWLDRPAPPPASCTTSRGRMRAN
jgi:hypothetical protein